MCGNDCEDGTVCNFPRDPNDVMCIYCQEEKDEKDKKEVELKKSEEEKRVVTPVIVTESEKLSAFISSTFATMTFTTSSFPLCKKRLFDDFVAEDNSKLIIPIDVEVTTKKQKPAHAIIDLTGDVDIKIVEEQQLSDTDFITYVVNALLPVEESSDSVVYLGVLNPFPFYDIRKDSIFSVSDLLYDTDVFTEKFELDFILPLTHN